MRDNLPFGMKSIEQIKSFTEEKFKQTFGVNQQNFDDMLKILEDIIRAIIIINSTYNQPINKNLQKHLTK